jgi:hypothetical protein
MFADKEVLTYRKIFIFWLPLAATWLMMATEGPFLAAVIARLADPKYNLAAHGVAFSFAVLIEAPIIMIMSASTALVKDCNSYTKLRNFTYALNGIITALMVILIIPPVFDFISLRLIGLPPEVARLTHKACIIFLPWPGAIGYRRFYQGILIRSNLTRRVAYGTMVRLVTMAVVASVCYFFLELEGAVVGALALTLAVSAEAISSKLMARNSAKNLCQNMDPSAQGESLTYRYIAKFYYPLALTSMLALGVYPMVTFFMGQSRMSLESLAVFPVVSALVFIFRSLGLSFQEVVIALLGDANENFQRLRNFALVLGTTVVSLLALIALTPLSSVWFQKVSGLSEPLALFSLAPAKILILIPGLTVLISFQRGLLVTNKRTTPITIATAIEVTSIFCLLFLTIHVVGWVGAVAAAVALVCGRIFSNFYLSFPCYQIITKRIRS